MNFLASSSKLLWLGVIALTLLVGCSHEVEQTKVSVDSRVELAREQLAQGLLDAATNTLASIESVAGGDVDVRLLNAQLAWHFKDYSRSLKLFSEIADDSKLSADIRSEGLAGVGIVKMTIGEAHSARISFMKALRLNGKNAAVRYHLGHLYRESPFGYNEAALEQFETFVYLHTNADIRVQRVQKSIIPGLKEMIARVASERPGASSRNSALSATALGEAEAAWKKGNFKLARSKYEAAIKADPLSYPAALGYAKAIQKCDSSKAGLVKALENYKLACSLKPNASATFITAGELSLKLGMTAQASEIFSRALASNPSSSAALDGLIRALQRSGNRKQQALAKEYQTLRKAAPTKKTK